jgi:hypothetical protein
VASPRRQLLEQLVELMRIGAEIRISMRDGVVVGTADVELQDFV